jgi:hypothetical protein
MPRPPQSPLELRQVQTRAFDATDARLVLKAALNALQDEGYVIREANVNVTQEAAGTRVRFSLVSKVTEKDGSVRSVRPVQDALAYQALLARLDKAVYLQKEGL